MYTFQKGILVLLIFFALLQNHTFVIGQSDGHICFMNFFIYVWKCLPHEGGKVTSSTKKKGVFPLQNHPSNTEVPLLVWHL
jgi:hypothetical protein